MNKKQIKIKFREIIKKHDKDNADKGIYINDLFLSIEGDILDKKESLYELVMDGEIYEAIPNYFRFVD